MRMQGGIHITDEPLPVPDVYVEMHAAKLASPDEQHIARVDDAGPAALFRCACELAQMVGVRLEG